MKTTYIIARENNFFNDVVVVGPFTKELGNSDWPAKLSQSLGGPVQVHYVHCPPDERQRRLTERGNPRDLSKLRDWENYIQYYDESSPIFEHLLVEGLDYELKGKI